MLFTKYTQSQCVHWNAAYVNYGYAINLICQFCVFSYFVDLKNSFCRCVRLKLLNVVIHSLDLIMIIMIMVTATAIATAATATATATTATLCTRVAHTHTFT